ncbi:hypothetical protein D3C72_2105860 [compost metagenome]
MEEQGRVIAKLERLQRVDGAIGELATGDLHAQAHFRFVGDQQYLRLGTHGGLGEQAGDQLGADAGRVTQDHGDTGLVHAGFLCWLQAVEGGATPRTVATAGCRAEIGKR